jgi:hypothetical protein
MSVRILSPEEHNARLTVIKKEQHHTHQSVVVTVADVFRMWCSKMFGLCTVHCATLHNKAELEPAQVLLTHFVHSSPHEQFCILTALPNATKQMSCILKFIVQI